MASELHTYLTGSPDCFNKSSAMQAEPVPASIEAGLAANPFPHFHERRFAALRPASHELAATSHRLFDDIHQFLSS
jgi:hypothetical protein